MAEHDHLCGLVRFTGSHDLFGGHCSAEVIEAGEGVIEYDDLVRNMGIAFELRQEEGEGKGIFVAGAHRRIEPRIVSASLGHIDIADVKAEAIGRLGNLADIVLATLSEAERSDERRVGTEWASTCRSRWAADQ